MFQQLDGKVDRNAMPYAVLHIFHPMAAKEQSVNIAHVVLGIHRIADIQLLVPTALAGFTDFFQRIKAVGGKRQFGQGDGDLLGQIGRAHV